jgi:hypothetical protein
MRKGNMIPTGKISTGPLDSAISNKSGENFNQRKSMSAQGTNPLSALGKNQEETKEGKKKV